MDSTQTSEDMDLRAIEELFTKAEMHTRGAIIRDRANPYSDQTKPVFVPVEASVLLKMAEQGRALVALVLKLQGMVDNE